MTAALVARHRGVGVPALLHEICQKRRIQERHVAAYHQDLFRRCVHQRRVETAQRSGSRDAIGHHPRVSGPNSRWVARDDQDVWCEAAQ